MSNLNNNTLASGPDDHAQRVNDRPLVVALYLWAADDHQWAPARCMKSIPRIARA